MNRNCLTCDGQGAIQKFTWTGWFRCDACNGSGEQSDSMPRADAMADAETLRRVLGKPSWDEMDKRTTERGRIACAGFYGEEASRWMAERYPSSDAILYSINAAFEAFRAVPGLRG